MKSELVTLTASAVCILILSACITAALEKQDEGPDDSFLSEQKRPFCNAFTGCGGKRSVPTRHNLLAHIQNRLLNEARAWDFQRRITEDGRDGRGNDVLADELRSNGLLMDLLPPSLRKRRFASPDAE